MTDIDKRIEAALQHEQSKAEAGRVSGFASVWAGAEARIGQSRRRIRAAGGMAAVAAFIAVVVIGRQGPVEPDWQFIDPNDIAGGTSWAAPSDVLLPTHQFDIYRDIPVLIESTGMDGGTLL